MDEAQEIEQLRADVAQKFGHTIESPSDYAQLQLQIEKSTGEAISESTLKRIFGYTATSSSPRRSTLSVLARYLGYPGWSDYVKHISGSEAVNEITVSKQPKSFFAKHKHISINIAVAIVSILITVIIIRHLPFVRQSHLSDTVLYERISQQYDKQTLEQYTLAMEAFENYAEKTDSMMDNWMEKRNALVKDFSISRLENLPRSEYDFSNPDGFAYRIKNELKDFNMVDSQQYECQGYDETQYRDHMRNIVQLLKDGASSNKRGISSNPLYPPLKHYLLMVYFPKSDYMPIWVDEQVEHFLDVFLPDKDLRAQLTPADCLDKREILVNFKNAHPIMKKWDNITFGNFLFHFFPRDRQFYHDHNGIVDKYYGHSS